MTGPIELHRYPRTRHVEGSATQPGDDDLELAQVRDFVGRHMVVSEKIDGANAAVSFSDQGRLLLQSRSRFLDERTLSGTYAGFHDWATQHEDLLWPVLRDRYVMFGEWVFTKQTVFYDALPNAFLELDVLDKDTGEFLSTPRRRQLLRGLPIVSAPVLAEGTFQKLDEVRALLGPSRFKTPGWRDELLTAIALADVEDCERFIRETDPSDDMEGLVLKREENGVVVARAKYVRPGFRSPYLHTSSQWLAQRKVRNRVLEDA
jgi:hypothetical protein